jgi:hypothetical protein
MRLRSSGFPLDAGIATLVAIAAVSAPSSGLAQGGARGGPIDEATLVITKAGAPWGTETFRISSVGAEGSGQLRVTAQRMVGEQRFSTSLTTDSLGVPSSYELSLKEGPIETLHLTVHAGPGRLASLASDQKRNESMKEYLPRRRPVPPVRGPGASPPIGAPQDRRSAEQSGILRGPAPRGHGADRDWRAQRHGDPVLTGRRPSFLVRLRRAFAACLRPRRDRRDARGPSSLITSLATSEGRFRLHTA